MQLEEPANCGPRCAASNSNGSTGSNDLVPATLYLSFLRFSRTSNTANCYPPPPPPSRTIGVLTKPIRRIPPCSSLLICSLVIARNSLEIQVFPCKDMNGATWFLNRFHERFSLAFEGREREREKDFDFADNRGNDGEGSLENVGRERK